MQQSGNSRHLKERHPARRDNVCVCVSFLFFSVFINLLRCLLFSLLLSLKSVFIRLTLFIAPRQTTVTAQMIRGPVISGSSFWLTEILNHVLKCEI